MNLYDHLSEHDIFALKALVMNPSLKPRYNEWLDALVWQDESPPHQATGAFHLANRLWIARSYLFHRKDVQLAEDERQHYTNLWHRSFLEFPNWPGFHDSRVNLSKDDQRFYAQEVEKYLASGEY